MSQSYKILFYEPSHKGHHFPYLARMLPGFCCLPVDIHLALTKEGVASQEFRDNLRPFQDRITIHTDCAPPRAIPPIRNAILRSWELNRLTARFEPDHVFVLYADGLWAVRALQDLVAPRIPNARNRPSRTSEGIIYGGAFTYPRAYSLSAKTKRWLFRHFVKNRLFDRLLIDDDYLYDFASSLSPTQSCSDVVLVPNPVMLEPLRATATGRAAFALTDTDPIISLSGLIDRRKGADLLLHAFAEMTSEGTPARLLLAGPHSADLRSLLTQPPFSELVQSDRIVSIDRTLSAREMLDVAVASDIVTAPYPNQSGRSSIILWAAAAGRRVVAVNKGCIERMVSSEKLGLVCNVSDAREFARTLKASLAMPWADDDVARVRKYATFHAIDNYQRVCTEYLRGVLAARSSPP